MAHREKLLVEATTFSNGATKCIVITRTLVVKSSRKVVVPTNKVTVAYFTS